MTDTTTSVSESTTISIDTNAQDTTSFSQNVSSQQTPVAGGDLSSQAPLQSDSLTVGDYSDAQAGQEAHWKIQKSFTFGIENQHVVFTKPVAIHVSMTDATDGTLVLLLVKHAGEDGFGNQ